MQIQHQAIALQVARQVRGGELTRHAGAQLLSAKTGIPATSAGIVIAVYINMSTGQVFKRTLSASDMEYIVSRIADDEGTMQLTKALAALRLHIEYRKSAGVHPHQHKAILEKYEEWLNSATTAPPKVNQPAEPPGHQYRYGDRPTWEVVLDAVRRFGRPVSLTEVGDHIVSEIPDFNRRNLGPDLSVLSVNCFSRGNHAVNRAPRRTDAGNDYDKLIRIGKGRGVRFTLYDPSVHGVWALVDVGEKTLRPRFLDAVDAVELEHARRAAVAEGMFDPSEDARRRIMAAIVQREGQPAFRKALLVAYGGACAISGCKVESLLEAAHIVPYGGAQTNLVGNGLLLRADLHKLFDLHLFRIDPITRKIHLSEVLKNSEYARFEGAVLREPSDVQEVVLTEALKHHEERCGWMNGTPGGATLGDY